MIHIVGWTAKLDYDTLVEYFLLSVLYSTMKRCIVRSLLMAQI